MTASEISWKKYLPLHQKKHREALEKCVIEGVRLCKEGLASNWKTEAAFLTEAFFKSEKWAVFQKIFLEKDIPWRVLPQQHFHRLAATESPQGIAIVMQMPQEHNRLSNFAQSTFLLILESVRDPGNLGTLIRTADWFGVDAILLSNDCVSPLNNKVIRSTMGAIFRAPVLRSASLAADIQRLKTEGFAIAAAAINGNDLFSVSQFRKTALILGNEAHGISSEALKESQTILRIPRYGKAESLNVAIAGGIFMAHITANMDR